MVTKPNFKKKNHYILPTMPKERKAIKKVICNHLPRPHKEKWRGYHHDINESIKWITTDMAFGYFIEP